jgi:hypothetical protein
LVDHQLAYFGGNRLDDLDGTGAGAYDSNAFAAHVDALLRPPRGVKGGPSKVVDALNLGQVRLSGKTQSVDHPSSVQDPAVGTPDGPPVALLVEGGLAHIRVASDAAGQVPPIDDMVKVCPDLFVAGKGFLPSPVVRDFGVSELVHGVPAVDASAGIAIPVPDASVARRFLETLDAETCVLESGWKSACVCSDSYC